MKKFIILLLVIFSFTLVGCNKEGGTDDIFIYMYLDHGDADKNVIELYNPTNKAIKLDDKYTLNIYSNGELEPRTVIKLVGELQPEKFYIIASASNTEIDQDIISLKTGLLRYNGDDAIAIHKDKKIVDLMGFIGFATVFGQNTTLVRFRDELKAYNDFDGRRYIDYGAKRYDLLNKPAPEIDKKVLNAGPKFDPATLEMPFSTTEENIKDRKGLGGSIKVTLSRHIDGDTSEFVDKDGNKYYTRYAFIDTPESSPRVGYHAWGFPASKTCEALLGQATNIYLQSVKGMPLIGPFDRYWGIIWVDDLMLNFLMVKAGFTEVNKLDLYEDSLYEGIPYLSYLNMAYLRAQELNLGTFSKNLDDTYDYDALTLLPGAVYYPDLESILNND